VNSITKRRFRIVAGKVHVARRSTEAKALQGPTYRPRYVKPKRGKGIGALLVYQI
jgi:hypothetical protein